MRIVFLGTGGGRFNLITQLRSTAGIFLEINKPKFMRFYIDPGSGAMVKARENKINLQTIKVLLVSHSHPEHYADAECVIEAMTSGTLKKKGILAASISLLEGYKDKNVDFFPHISKYHQNALAEVHAMKAGDRFKVGAGGEVEIIATPTKHSDPTNIGFIIKASDGTIGYTSDGGYFAGMEKYFKGVDMLIINCMFPRTKEGVEMRENEKMHMNVWDAAKLIKAARPKLAILQHFGMKMQRSNPWGEAAWIEKETGIKTIAAKDGQVIEFDVKKESEKAAQKKLADK